MRQTLTLLAIAALTAGLLPAPAASAPENNEPDTLYTVSTHKEFQNALNDEDELVEGDGALTILIDDNISTETDGELVYDGDADLVLYGDETVTLDGGGQNRILNAESSGADIIEVAGDMTWQHGSVNTNGGAIFVVGDVEVSGDATFEGNTADDGARGGAIYSEGDVTVSGDAIFEGNTANLGGGAIFADGDVEVSGDATFEDNTASVGVGGGAIRANGDVAVSGDATFEGNTASGGGAIRADGDVEVSGDATFEDNTADQVGGAIRADGGVEVSGDATFEDNTANFGGGAIYSEGDVTVSGDATFTGNEASFGGGAIVAVGGVEVSGDATFEGNIAFGGFGGGAVVALDGMGGGGDVDVSGDAKFTDNEAHGGSGGAISADGNPGPGGTVTVSGNAKFDGNTAVDVEGVSIVGGAISATGGMHSGDGEVVVSAGSSFAGVAADEVDVWADPGGAGTDSVDPPEPAVPGLALDGPEEEVVAGEQTEGFSATVTNHGAELGGNVEVAFTLSHDDGLDTGDVTLEYRDDDGEWQQLTLEEDDGGLMGRFGPDEGFQLDADYAETTQLRATVNKTSEVTTEADLAAVDNDTVYAGDERTFEVADPAPPPLPAPTPEPDPEADPAPERSPVVDERGRVPAPGGGGGMVDGVTVEVETAPTGDGGVSVTGSGYGITVRPEAEGDGEGSEASDEPPGGASAEVVLRRGRRASVEVAGFAPSSEVGVWLFSEPVLLGSFRTDAAGALAAASDIVADEVAACPHVLHAEGVLADGRSVAVSTGVWVEAERPRFGDVPSSSAHARAVQCLAELEVTRGVSAQVYAPFAPLTRGQAASLLAGLFALDTSRSSDIVDVAGTTHEGAIAALVEAGAAQGYRNGLFEPTRPVSRGEFASLLAALAGLDTDGVQAGFSDVEGTHAGAVGVLAAEGVVRGFTDGRFAPTAEVTRAQTASMLTRALPLAAD